MVQGAVTADRAGTSADRIVFLGHASVLIELDGVVLLTDPLLRGHVGPLRRHSAPVDRNVIARTDAMLISHMHRDHLDLSSLRALGRDRPLVVPVGAGAWLRRRGFDAVTELRAGETVHLGPLAVMAVPARHDGRRNPGGRGVQSLGYVVRGTRQIYFAGDTELFDGMAALSARLDVALLPVAGWGPKLGPGHMNPLQAARAAKILRPHVVIPVHWGTLQPIITSRRQRARFREPPREFAQNVSRLAPSVEVRILAPGQETTL
jgi:L-ascorbate metabolism protein UlaG (beta-lactamase superfamily)